MMQQRINILVKASKSGDTNAASQLLDLFAQPVYSYLYRLCRNREDAEDLTQQTFIKAWSSLSTYQQRCRFPTWLHQIAYRVYLDWCRKKKPPVFSTEQFREDFLAQTVSPFRSVAERQMAEQLYQAVERLDDNKRQVIYLHYYQTLSLREVAQVLDVSTSTVKYRIRQALKILQQAIADYESDPLDIRQVSTESGDLT